MVESKVYDDKSEMFEAFEDIMDDMFGSDGWFYDNGGGSLPDVAMIEEVDEEGDYIVVSEVRGDEQAGYSFNFYDISFIGEEGGSDEPVERFDVSEDLRRSRKARTVEKAMVNVAKISSSVEDIIKMGSDIAGLSSLIRDEINSIREEFFAAEDVEGKSDMISFLDDMDVDLNRVDEAADAFINIGEVLT